MQNSNVTAQAQKQSFWHSPDSKLIIGLMAPSLMVGMNHHMFGVALPSIRNDFVIAPDVVAWVSMSYTLAFLMFMPLYGRLGDILGKQRLILLGTIIFMSGTVVVMSATSMAWLLAGRFIQGMGTAGFVPLSIAIITQRFAVEERGRMLGAWNSIIPLSGLAFPFVAGMLVDAFGWRAMYPPILLAAIIALILVRRFIQPMTTAINFRYLRSFDWMGVLLLSLALAGLLFYTSSRPITGVPALLDLRLLSFWLLMFVVLILWERRRIDPFIDLAIFRKRQFSFASLCAGMRMMLMTSISFLIPLYMSDIHGSSAKIIGVALTVQAGMLFVTSRFGGQLADRMGSRLPVTLSMAGQIVVMLVLANLPATAPVWTIFIAAMAQGFLIGLSLAPLHLAAMQDVEGEEVGMAAGLYSMIRFAGQILGTAAAGVLLQAGLERFGSPIAAYQTVFYAFALVAVIATLVGLNIRSAERVQTVPAT